jgi:hypothetical protein
LEFDLAAFEARGVEVGEIVLGVVKHKLLRGHAGGAGMKRANH